MRWADVVHLTGVYNFPTFPSIFWARLLNKRLVWSPRGGFSDGKALHELALKRFGISCGITLRIAMN